ncbi:hypothetical protein D3C87_2040790 [compost metagenome]
MTKAPATGVFSFSAITLPITTFCAYNTVVEHTQNRAIMANMIWCKGLVNENNFKKQLLFEKAFEPGAVLPFGYTG